MCVLQHVFVPSEIGRHTAIDEYVLDAIAGRGASVVQRVDLVAQGTAGLKQDTTHKNAIRYECRPKDKTLARYES